MSRLNRDILFLIFEELQADSRSLFSCLMVKRIWCETAIPILWRNPWRYDINYYHKNSLYDVITSYLTDDIKELLSSQGLALSPITYQSLLFDYLSFCRSISVNVMNCIIPVSPSSYYTRFLFQQELYTLLIRKCPELKYLDMRSIHHQIFYFPEAKIRLDSLCELKCETSIDSSYFYGLAYICKNIQRLIIINRNTKINQGTVKLIQVQKNLKYFEWQDSYDDDYFMEILADPYKENFLALANHANTLSHFVANLQYDYEFNDGYDYTFLPDTLSKLRNLKTLKFVSPPFSRTDCEKRLKTFVYRYLEIFRIDELNINTATSIMKNSGGYIRKILINTYYIDEFNKFNDESLNLIRTIHENCPLIECLSLDFPLSRNHFIEFETLLRTCQKLRSLHFPETYFSETYQTYTIESSQEKEYGENLLNILNRSAPTNLREIGFLHKIKFSLEAFEIFLKNWRGRPAISIFTYYIYREDYLKLINKYKKEGVIKEVGDIIFMEM